MIRVYLRRIFGRTHGPVRPGGRAMAVLAAVLVVIFGGLAFVYGWAMNATDSARTLALAARVLDRPVPLESALDVNWSRSVALEGGGVRQSPLETLESVLPPAICADLGVPAVGRANAVASPGIILEPNRAGRTATDRSRSGEFAIDRAQAAGINRAVRALDAAIERGAREDLEGRIMGMLRLADAPRGSVGAFLMNYNLARGYLAARDEASAARVLEQVFNDRTGYISYDRVPLTNFDGAMRRIRTGTVDAANAARAFYARFLAGTIAYERGEMPRAISHFRLALNALNFILAARTASSTYTPRGHYERFEIPLYSPCAGTRPDAALSSLDGYSALIRAYLAADGFRDADDLVGEVRRGRFEMDENDPFAPLLRYARAAGPGGLADGPVPANFVWAASNLQRVYHHNQRNPDPRLETARGVLVLQLVDRPEWLAVLEPYGGGNACRLLSRVGRDLADDARALAVSSAKGHSAPDSALAAVAVRTFARAHRQCGETMNPELGSAVRSAWLRLGGRFLGGGLAGRYEGYRRAIVEALGSANASTAVITERIREPVVEVRNHLDYFDSGRTPPALAASIDPGDGADFVRDWWRAIFLDLANELTAAARGENTGSPLRLRAAQAEEFLTALNSAIAYADVRPSEVYDFREFAPIARSLGTSAELRYRARYAIRSHPVLAVLGTGIFGLLLGAVAVLVYVSVWRFRLLTRDRIYRAELAERVRNDGEIAIREPPPREEYGT